MPLLKRTYSLPHDVLEQFEQKVGTGKRSAVIAELIDEWLQKHQREQLRRDIIEGCREMGDVYLEVEQEYHAADEEVWHALDEQSTQSSKARRHRSAPLRPGRRVRAGR